MEGFKKGAQCGAGVVSQGEAMGFAKGGHVKSSPQFLMKTKKTGNPADKGVQPAKKGDNEMEKEAGGTPKLKPGYKKGGRAKSEKGGEKSYTFEVDGKERVVHAKTKEEAREKLRKSGVTPNKKMAHGGLARAKHGSPYRSEPLVGKR